MSRADRLPHAACIDREEGDEADGMTVLWQTWFFPDFFGSVPFDKIVSSVLEDGEQYATTLR